MYTIDRKKKMNDIFEYNPAYDFKDNLLMMIDFSGLNDNIKNILGRKLDRSDFHIIGIRSSKENSNSYTDTCVTIKGEPLKNLKEYIDLHYKRINLYTKGRKGDNDELLIGGNDVQVQSSITKDELENKKEESLNIILNEILEALEIKWLDTKDSLVKDFWIKNYEEYRENIIIVDLNFSEANPFYVIDFYPDNDKSQPSTKIKAFVKLKE